MDSAKVASVLFELISELAGPDVELDDSIELVDGPLGFDSIRVVELALSCESRFEIRLDLDRMLSSGRLSIGQLRQAIESKAR